MRASFRRSSINRSRGNAVLRPKVARAGLASARVYELSSRVRLLRHLLRNFRHTVPLHLRSRQWKRRREKER